MVKLSFKTGLDSNKFHAGLDEVRRHFEGNRDDAYLSGLLAEVEAANQALIGALNFKVAKQGINREAKELNERLASASRYIDSCRYVSDQAVRASAQVLKQRFSSEGKPFNHMKVDTRVGAVRVLLRDLATPEMQAHVGLLPDLSVRIAGVRTAVEALAARQLEVDQANSQAEAPRPLLPLKRDAAAKLHRLVVYLQAMAEKDPEGYATHYAVVTEIITRLNATQGRSATKAKATVEAEIPMGPHLAASA